MLLKKVQENWFKIYSKPLLYRNFYLTDFDKNLILPKIKLSTCIDLKLSEDNILNNFKSNYRNEIKKCHSLSYFTEISRSNIANIKKEYDVFALNKKLTKLNKSRLLFNKCIIGINQFDTDSKCCNIYLKNNNKVVLLYSYTLGNYSKMSSSALKKLHYEAMLYFKKNGANIYDFGGISLNPKLKGINKLKLGFGGKRTFYYSGISLRSKFSRLIRNIFIDFCHPKKFLRGTIKSNLKGYHDTANSDYETLLLIFKNIDFENYNTFYDIGCGKGAVYAFFKYFNLLQSIEYFGIEYNKKVFDKYLQKNPEIFHCCDALNYEYKHNSLFYLYNPFDFEMVLKFVDLLPSESILITYNIEEIKLGKLKIKSKLIFNKKIMIMYEVCSAN